MVVRHQKGQVLPLGLALLLFGVLGAFVVFNTGQVATDKMKLANTADAAAYSGTLWQARALNFQSYSNRAMVANQVTIAQAVTLQSWVNYGAITTANLATVLDPVPVINVVANGLQRGLDVANRVIGPISQSIVTVVDIVNRGLSMAQKAMFVSTFVATPDVIRQVVNETDDRFTIKTGFSALGLASNLSGWKNFTDGYTADDLAAMNERELLINQSRDQFTRTRNWKFFNNWFYSTPITRHRIHREGETRLIRVNSPDGVKWEWKAKDTMSLHNKIWHWRGSKHIELPIGWGEAFANSQNKRHTIEPGACYTFRQVRRNRHCARFLDDNKIAERGADLNVRGLGAAKGSDVDPLTAMKNYTGVQAYRSLSQGAIQEERPRLTLKVEVALPTTETVTTASIGSTGRFESPVNTPGNQITSVSVAEVFYKRPDADQLRANGQVNRSLERANGYNPYWSARLSPISNAERMLAFSLRPGAISTSAPNSLGGTQLALSNYTESSNRISSDFYGAGIAAVGAQALTDFDRVAAQFATGDLQQMEAEVKEALTEQFEEAVKNMLSGAVSGALGGQAHTVSELQDELKQTVQDGVDGFVSTEVAQEMTTLVASVEAEAARLQAEFERIRTTIVQSFESVFTEALAATQIEIDALYQGIAEAKNKIDNHALNEDGIRREQRRIERLREDVKQLREDLKTQLTDQLIDIVNDSTDRYVMPWGEARYVVTLFLELEESERGEGIQLPWLDGLSGEDDAI